MEAAMEMEDDLFFKDLSKQISLLIMDDDDDNDDDDQDSLSHSPQLNLQSFRQAINPATQAASYFSYDHHRQISKRSESKGTGVFIPRSTSNLRRKSSKQARFMASGNKFQRDHNIDHGSRGLPYNNTINPYYDQSLNLRRF